MPPVTASTIFFAPSAMVVAAVKLARSAMPHVLVHDPTLPADEALFLDLNPKAGAGIRRALRAQELPSAARDYLQPRQHITYGVQPLPRSGWSWSRPVAAGNDVRLPARPPEKDGD